MILDQPEIRTRQTMNDEMRLIYPGRRAGGGGVGGSVLEYVLCGCFPPRPPNVDPGFGRVNSYPVLKISNFSLKPSFVHLHYYTPA